ncbi:MAG: ATP-binding cassette domain-containing protein, partial [Hyphomicrobiaceae bacterium]
MPPALEGDRGEAAATVAACDACSCGHDHADGAHTHGGAAPSPDVDTTALISARGLTFIRGGRTILDHVDIDLHHNEIVTLIGPNGAGKTSLVRLLLGLDRANHGRLHRSPSLVVGYAPQRFDIDAALPMTVERFRRLGISASRRDVAAALDEVGAG